MGKAEEKDNKQSWMSIACWQVLMSRATARRLEEVQRRGLHDKKNRWEMRKAAPTFLKDFRGGPEGRERGNRGTRNVEIEYIEKIVVICQRDLSE